MNERSRTWREQEERVVARWNAATERHRVARQAIAEAAAPAGEPGDAQALQAEEAAARAELNAVRRQVARLKVEFASGKRY